MFEIHLSSRFRSACPNFVGMSIEMNVHNTPSSPLLWEEINACTELLLQNLSSSNDLAQTIITETRMAYKSCGKDPSRYRPSAEALRRRVLNGLSLYRIHTLVDLINLVSLQTGFSINAFDAELIDGTSIELGLGTAEDCFEGIGRGQLNIENLPAYKDRQGAFGTPTSDSERTKMTLSTRKMLVLINGFEGEKGLEEARSSLVRLCTQYAQATEIGTHLYD